MQARKTSCPNPGEQLPDFCWGCWLKQTNTHSAGGHHLLRRINLMNKIKILGVMGRFALHLFSKHLEKLACLCCLKTTASNETDSLLKYSPQSQEKRRGGDLFVCLASSITGRVYQFSWFYLFSFLKKSSQKCDLLTKQITRLPSSGYAGKWENCHLLAGKCSL